MAIPINLQQFKHSNVYRLTFDKSQTQSINVNTIRLIIGYSNKGPYNTPVFVQDDRYFKSVFGNIDKKLERRGSFFHRTALVSLETGPIIALNLLKVDEDDKTNYINISTTVNQKNDIIADIPVESIYNKSGFWYVDADEINRYLTNANLNKNLLTFVNTGESPVSIIVKKSDVTGFDVTAKEWFNNEIPEYIDANDLISDYFVDVIFINGNFSNYDKLIMDPIYGKYFTNNGLKKEITGQFGEKIDGLTEFLNSNHVDVINVYSGALFPEFMDKNGVNLSIVDQINRDSVLNNVVASINIDEFDNNPELIGSDKIDIIGNTIKSEFITKIDYLSYKESIVSELEVEANDFANLKTQIDVAFIREQSSNALGLASAELQSTSDYIQGMTDTLMIFGPDFDFQGQETSIFANQFEFETFYESLTNNAFIDSVTLGGTGDDGSILESKIIEKSINKQDSYIKIMFAKTVESSDINGPTNINVGFMNLDLTSKLSSGVESVTITNNMDFIEEDNDKLIVGRDSELANSILDGTLTSGDKIDSDGIGNIKFIKITRNTDTEIQEVGFDKSTNFINYYIIEAFDDEEFTMSSTISDLSEYKFITFKDDLNEQFEIIDRNYTEHSNVVYLDNSLGNLTGAIKAGQYLLQNFGDTVSTYINPKTGKSKLTRILSVTENKNPLDDDYQILTVTTQDPIYILDDGNLYIERFKSILEYVSTYNIHSLDGFIVDEDKKPDGTLKRQNEILDVLTSTNLKDALCDRENIEYRYIVDTFEGGIEPSSKSRLTKLAKDNGSALAILNMPSVKQFSNSVNPLFKENSKSVFDAKYIASGGNLDLNPTNKFTLPSIDEGSNFGAYYGPNLILTENGKQTSVPMSAYVSNLFIRKYNLDTPYAIIAGPRRGVIEGRNILDVEYKFNPTEMDAIEPFGYNAILRKKGFGLVINANQTGQQNIKSALSQIHVRELVIYIQDSIEQILKNYRWEFNTAQNRLEIKTLADSFMYKVLSDGGVYDFDNVMDTTNNTREIIDNNMGILDTYIEPVRGMGVLVHRTTILKTGELSTDIL